MWRDRLQGDPVPWLLEPENPSVRLCALTELLDRPAGDPEAQVARAAIPEAEPVASLLAAQTPAGYWFQRDYYLPKYSGTFWVLSALGDLGLTAKEEGVQRACEYMFSFQRESGAFCRRRRIAGRGIVWDDRDEPCTQARIVRFLIQFGYGEDPRTRAAIDWLVENRREDGMWHCRGARGRGCLRATLDVLRAAALDPELAAQPAVSQGVGVVAGLLMGERMDRYHVDDLWRVVQYPCVDYSVLSALDALGRLGVSRSEPRVADALAYVLSRQDEHGRWPLDQVPHRPAFDPGPTGQPSKWVTLDALRVVKLSYGV